MHMDRRLNPAAAKHCNFQIIERGTTGTYAFRAGYHRQTTMPLELQKIKRRILHKTNSTFTVIAKVLIVTKGTAEEHKEKIEEAADGIKHVDKNKQAMPDKRKGKNLKDLKLFMEALNQLNKCFI